MGPVVIPDVTLSSLEPADLDVVLELLGTAQLPTVGVVENPGAFVVAHEGI